MVAFEMKEKIDAQSRQDPGEPCVSDRGGPALSARVATERNRISRQVLAGAEERAQSDLVRRGEEKLIGRIVAVQSPLSCASGHSDRGRS